MLNANGLLTIKTALVIMMFCLGSVNLFAQSFPVTIVNHTGTPDSNIFVCVVGQDLTTNKNYIWIDLTTGQQKPMKLSNNTVQGPIYNGDKGPGGNGKYANCFTKLSDITNRKFMLDKIQGCRMFFSLKSQLYLYFFGQDTVFGYAAPSSSNLTDPNRGIEYEIIELTYDNSGFYGNTTRVDFYQRPMAMKLYGDGLSAPLHVGEQVSNQTVLSTYMQNAPDTFKNCIDTAKGLITQPSKTADFSDGSISGIPKGPYQHYFKSYIDAIWNKYSSQDLDFDAGENGIWKGNVSNDTLKMNCQSQCPAAFVGVTATITRKPTTQEAFEGKGVLNQANNNAIVDKAMQAQICAAINRHVIDVTTANPGVQNWGDTASYYKTFPYNWYAKFWHSYGISVNNFSYGFAYDDVFKQSSSVHTVQTDSLTIFIGGMNHATSSHAVAQSNEIKLYPNPLKDMLFINLNGYNSNSYAVEFFEIASGKKMLSTKFDSGDAVDIGNKLPAGVYLVHLINHKAEVIVREKLIVE
tara:strand:- start:808 stop:2373 length:1566 start_codon:yes stop_codon:yes gene_type:complete